MELTAIEQARLTRFADDEALREAVRKVLVEQSHYFTNFDLSNAEIGERLRAEWEAVKRINDGFSYILQFATQPEVKGRTNEAR